MSDKLHDNSIWKTLAEQLGGQFFERQFHQSEYVIVNYKNFQIKLDHYTVYRPSGATSLERTYTRIMVPYVAEDQFTFEMHRDHHQSKTSKIETQINFKTGDETFDNRHTIKTSDHLKLSLILGASSMVDLINAPIQLNLLVSSDHGIWENALPEGHYELSYFADGKLKDIRELQSLFELFKLLIQSLIKYNDIAPSSFIQE